MNSQAKAIEISKQFGLTSIAPDLDLRGKNVVITGAAAGIGAGIAKMAHQLGANVIAIDIQEDALRALEAELGHDRITGIKFDLSQTDPDVYSSLGAVILESTPNGQVDSYIMNAGVVKLAKDGYGLTGSTAKELQTVMQINAWSHGDLLRGIGVENLADDARIVVTTSPIVGRSDPNTPGYAISKQTLEAVANQIRGELADTNVTVAGYVPPPVQNFLRTDLKPNEPIHAHPHAEDMAELPLRLASPSLKADFNGVVVAMAYDHLRDKSQATPQGHAFDFMPRDGATNGFLYDLRTRQLANGGGDSGDLLQSWDTSSSRNIQGLGRTPDMDVNTPLKHVYTAPEHIAKHRSS